MCVCHSCAFAHTPAKMTLDHVISVAIVTHSFSIFCHLNKHCVSNKNSRFVPKLTLPLKQSDDTQRVNKATNSTNAFNSALSFLHLQNRDMLMMTYSCFTTLQCWSRNQLIKHEAIMSVGAVMCKKTSK